MRGARGRCRGPFPIVTGLRLGGAGRVVRRGKCPRHAAPDAIQRLAGHRIAAPLGNADVRLAVDVLDPRDDRLERMSAGVGEGGGEAGDAGRAVRGCAWSGRWRWPRRVAMRSSSSAGLGPFGRHAFALLRVWLPVAGRRRGEKNKVSNLRGCLNAGIQRANGVSASRSRARPCRSSSSRNRAPSCRSRCSCAARSLADGPRDAGGDAGFLDRFADRGDLARRRPGRPKRPRARGRPRRPARRGRRWRPPRRPCRRSARRPEISGGPSPARSRHDDQGGGGDGVVAHREAP